ncbi:P-loop containing nucleoside triphosphate hydrolase protein [Dioszegia hungarica]|uniref:P-loop containing nucleoside triphosphate hydrolase protein n=1 Tax=Dioszegia hungarica TaxID=4972 RepID=A0AA38LTP3_9TREE|nr:P-loop containing nucleoside triphosphate hydrolase protein [Dioszegia hungarica]KAI9632791.1 P-loop containing nucleoside triphosphate hydrolase protein [Dioszegia hungarica]
MIGSRSIYVRPASPVYVPPPRVQPRCDLPPLRAETASGSYITFNRRFKPSPPSLTVSRGTAPSLLGQPLHRLMKDVEDLKNEQKAIQLQRKYDEETRRAALEARTAAGVGPGRTMWVDKYRPKKFSDLLGEDRTHRDVMSWLKEWDKCVFKRAAPSKKRKAGAEEEENPYTDALGRPRERILLLSGPPGFGKTTLAHVLTKQAGYRTLEINASDDRNAATVSTRIKNAIEAGGGIMDKGRPVCVVVDEIDGATGGDQSFVKSLIKLIQDVPANRKKNTPARPLRRPIICICNDLYANALRPLRPYARIVRFRKPAPQILVKRLQEVCERESLQADLRVLTSLVDLTGGDVRSCLNTLQFIKSKSRTVTEDQIRTASIGSKDSLTTLQNVWNALFIPLASKERRKRQASSGSDGRYIHRLVPLIASSGDMDRLVQGCFEHYPNLKPLDGSLANVSKLLDGPLGFYDTLSKRVGEGEYEIMGYMAYAITGFHAHLAAPANSTRLTEWPKADYESYQARTVNAEVATTLKTGFPPILRSLFSTTTTLTELIPLLIRIITPPLRPVNANIVKPAERAVLDRLVELMIPHGLSFWAEKAENGQPMMRLEPPIDCFIHYDGKRADDVAAGRFAVRQVVAQAMDAEIARRKSGASGDTRTVKDKLVGMYGAAKPRVSWGTCRLRPRTKLTRPALDPEAELSATPPPPAKRFRAVYKFHEGSSSAVRKCIKMATLM